MPIGPILGRELSAAARRPRTYRRRSSVAALMLLVMAEVCGAPYLWDQGRLTVHEMAAFARAVFVILVLYQVNLTVWLVPVYVAGGIAAERERRTLGDLLTTCLSSAEIVLGKLAAGLVQFATCLAIGFPAMGLLALLAGLGPMNVLLACGGVAS